MAIEDGYEVAAKIGAARNGSEIDATQR